MALIKSLLIKLTFLLFSKVTVYTSAGRTATSSGMMYKDIFTILDDMQNLDECILKK